MFCRIVMLAANSRTVRLTARISDSGSARKPAIRKSGTQASMGRRCFPEAPAATENERRYTQVCGKRVGG